VAEELFVEQEEGSVLSPVAEYTKSGLQQANWSLTVNWLNVDPSRQ
jgi:hypothetical protein